MERVSKIKIPDRPTIELLKAYITDQWYAPQDALQRGLEASIWKQCEFIPPILEIGVGDGQTSKFIFSERQKITVGIDINPIGLEKALKTNIYRKVLQADATKLPFKNFTFNTVVSNSTFEHIRHDYQAVSEVSRVLKKRGLFFLTVPTNHFPVMIKDFERSEKIKKLKKVNERLNHFHYYSLKKWQAICTKNYMRIVYFKFYEPAETFIAWYKLFLFSSKKIYKKELWSYLADSKFSPFLPKKLYIQLLLSKLKKPFLSGFNIKDETGAQVFIIAEKYGS